MVKDNYEIVEVPAFKDYRVFVVYGKYAFNIYELLQYLDVDARVSSVRAYTFNEGEQYVALVLVPESGYYGEGN